MAHPLACFSVIAPVTVLWLIWSKDVQVGFDRAVQPPLELQVMPAALSCEAACDCVSFVTADAGALTANSPRQVASRPTTRTAIRFLIIPPSNSWLNLQGRKPPGDVPRERLLDGT